LLCKKEERWSKRDTFSSFIEAKANADEEEEEEDEEEDEEEEEEEEEFAVDAASLLSLSSGV
jgi:hypothetical protein